MSRPTITTPSRDAKARCWSTIASRNTGVAGNGRDAPVDSLGADTIRYITAVHYHPLGVWPRAPGDADVNRPCETGDGTLVIRVYVPLNRHGSYCPVHYSRINEKEADTV